MFVNDKAPVLQMAGGMMSHNPLHPLAPNPFEYPPGYNQPQMRTPRPASKDKKVHYVAPDFYSEITEQPRIEDIEEAAKRVAARSHKVNLTMKGPLQKDRYSKPMPPPPLPMPKKVTKKDSKKDLKK
jgi:hypothetical protein